MRTPGIGRRLACVAYDGLLLVGVLFAAAFLFSALLRFTGQPSLLWPFRLYLLAVVAAYYLWFWLHGGQTLAMKTWGVRLVAQHGGRLDPWRAALRLALAWCLPLVGWLWAFFDAERQFLQDRLAGTRLVNAA
jgi:uncharacterized RDD family membrane protein YckC